MLAVEKEDFDLLSLYSAFFAVGGAISLKVRYMVLWEKPHPPKSCLSIQIRASGFGKIDILE